MATLDIIIHEYDQFSKWNFRWPPRSSGYLLFDVLEELKTFGHRSRIVSGPKHSHADVALLHVDATIVDDSYLALASRYARTINFGTGDISKRNVSTVRLARGDAWDGPVIVKGNLNAHGFKEAEHNRQATRRGRPIAHPDVHVTHAYQIASGMAEVGEQVWNDPDLIVERFVPEKDGDAYVIRTWVFMGNSERCTRQVSFDPIVKASKVIRYEPTLIPDEIRAERERLNFDFGKFDFVIHRGEPVLLDTNRTPGVASAIRPMMKAGARNLAEGLDELLRRG